MKKYRLILFLIVFLGFALRFTGSWYGYPFTLGHFDEIFSVRQAMSFGATKSLRPIMLMYPTFHSYVLFVIYIGYYLLGKLVGWFHTPADFAFLYLVKPFSLYFLARLVSVVSGSLTILVTYFIAKRVYSVKVGLWAAWLLAMMNTHIIYSCWAKPDIFMVLLSSVSLLFTCFILTDNRMKNYLLAGFFAGLATAAKYNAAFIIISLLTAHLLTQKNGSRWKGFLDKKLLGYFLMVGAGFFITSPYCILTAPFCYREVIYDLNMLHFGEPGNVNTLPYLWVIIHLLRNSLVFGLIFLIGIIYCLLRRKETHWVFLSFVLLFWLFIGKSSKISLHYLLPVYPAFSILGAVFLNDFLVFVSGRSKIIRIFLILFIIIFTSAQIWKTKIGFLGKDSRIIAKEWIEENIPAQSKIALFSIRYRDLPPLVSFAGEVPSVDYGPRAKAVYGDKRLEDLLDKYYASVKTYRIYKLERVHPGEELNTFLVNLGYPNNIYLKEFYQQGWKSLAQLKNEGIEYLILTDFLYGLYETLPDKRHPLYRLCKDNQEYFAKLMHSNELQLVKEVPANGLGPIIRIYKIIY